MPSHAAGIPKLADAIAAALYARIARHGAFPIDVLTTDWQPGAAPAIVHHRLLPVDLAAFPRPAERGAPLVNLPPALLLADLTGEYLHARLCHAALHAFAAENEARMAAMAAACTQIDRQLGALQARQRMVRQEEITAEIIELAAGQTASRRGGRERGA